MVGNISKSKGFKGDTGQTGLTGPEGPRGEKGERGEKGDTPNVTFRYDNNSGNLFYSADGIIIDKEYIDSNDIVTKDVLTDAIQPIEELIDELVNGIQAGKEALEELKNLSIVETSVLSGLETNKIYKLTTENAQIVGLPSVDATCQNQILVYLQTTGQISIIWGDDIAFVDDVIPTIGIGCYRIIFEYNSVLGKWVVGVIQDGAVV